MLNINNKFVIDTERREILVFLTDFRKKEGIYNYNR